jgi:hypothetical protein
VAERARVGVQVRQHIKKTVAAQIVFIKTEEGLQQTIKETKRKNWEWWLSM